MYLFEYDFSCMSVRYLKQHLYDGNDNYLGSNDSMEKSVPVVPGTSSDLFIRSLGDLSYYMEDPAGYIEYVESCKEYTRRYKAGEL